MEEPSVSVNRANTDSMEEAILAALQREFPDVEGNIPLEGATRLYNGIVLSERFQGLSFIERQQRVFGVLRTALGPEVQKISMLFTYTPSEYAQLQTA